MINQGIFQVYQAVPSPSIGIFLRNSYFLHSAKFLILFGQQDKQSENI
jgi:hypothetical protein